MFATAYAIDFVPVDEGERTAPFTLASLLRPRSGRTLPPASGGRFWPPRSPVLWWPAHDLEPDHRAYRGIPSVAMR